MELWNLKPFLATDLFWHPLKTPENLWFSDVFRGYQKRLMAGNGLVGNQKQPKKFNWIIDSAVFPFVNCIYWECRYKKKSFFNLTRLVTEDRITSETLSLGVICKYASFCTLETLFSKLSGNENISCDIF